jgi:ASC-1-like (ASCH) protein
MHKEGLLPTGTNLYANHRSEPYFTFVQNGQKSIEGRLRAGMYAEVKPGDFIRVQSVDESAGVVVEITAIREYASFADMLKAEALERVLPNVHTVDDGVAIYRSFYTEAQERACGVVALAFKRIAPYVG